jgi:hypothetical protein
VIVYSSRPGDAEFRRDSRGVPDGSAKLAFVHGAIDAVAGFPAELLEVLCSSRHQHYGPRLLMTAASQGKAEFVTDRGAAATPAWPVRARAFPNRSTCLILRSASRLGGGLNLIRQPGGAPRLRSAMRTHRNHVVRGQHSVPVRRLPQRRSAGSGSGGRDHSTAADTGSPGWRLTYAQRREVSVTLAEPLGLRVLLLMQRYSHLKMEAQRTISGWRSSPTPSCSGWTGLSAG